MSVIKPSYLSDPDELTHTPDERPGWSESFLIQAYDPVVGVGLFTHVNRTPWDVELWNDNFVVYLPDDRFVVAKGHGLGDDVGPAGGGTSMRSITPWEELSLTHRGGGQFVTGAEARAGGVADGQHVRFDADLTFRGHSPIFDLGHIEEAKAMDAHYEQHGRVTGTLHYGDETIDFSGTGMRDHSWGPRDLRNMGRHVWQHALFPSGRWFTVAEVMNPADTDVLIRMCVYGDATSRTQSRVLSRPALLDTHDDALKPFDIEFETPDGSTVIHSEVISPFPFAWVGATEMVLGFDRRSNPSHVYYETQMRHEWDGEIGYGYTERTVQL